MFLMHFLMTSVLASAEGKFTAHCVAKDPTNAVADISSEGCVGSFSVTDLSAVRPKPIATISANCESRNSSIAVAQSFVGGSVVAVAATAQEQISLSSNVDNSGFVLVKQSSDGKDTDFKFVGKVTHIAWGSDGIRRTEDHEMDCEAQASDDL